MKISKTLFKQYTRCPHVNALDDLYKKRMQSDVSIFGAADEDDLIDILHTMFDVETGEDLLEENNAQMESLLPYFTKLEAIAMEIGEGLFGGPIHHSPITKEQKKFSFNTKAHEYYCYVDGYLEKEEDIYIFEVKATTSKKFLELGPKINKIHHPLFIKEKITDVLNSSPEMPNKNAAYILKLKQYNIASDKFDKHYAKLYNRYDKVGRYVFDIAVEKMIVEEARKQQGLPPKKIHYYLAVLNSKYVFNGVYDQGEAIYKTSPDFEELVVFIDVNQIADIWQEELRKLRTTLEALLDHPNPILEEIGKFCEAKKPSKCPFIPTCWNKVLIKGSILEYLDKHNGFTGIPIYNKEVFPEKKAEFISNGPLKMDYFELIKLGYYTLKSIPKEWLERKNNCIQRECIENNQDFMNKYKVNAGYTTLKWPLYYLDFESFPCPLPRYQGEVPYTQSVFQYSLHIERNEGECDFDKDHLEYLAPDFLDHRIDLIKQLIKDIDLSKGGTVIVYNKSFEHSRIKEFALMFPAYAEALTKINDCMFDLLDLVKTSKSFYAELGFDEEESRLINYYHNDLAGSYSIKKVLPVFSQLSYNDLKVGNGGEAIAAYSNFPYLEKEDLEVLRNDLLVYCKQDTWAMAVVLWGLMKKAREGMEEY